MKKLVSIIMSMIMLFSIVTAVNVTAFAETSGVWTYSMLEDGTACITDYKGSGGSVTIPSALNGKMVTTIHTNAFEGCTGVTEVSIPKTITAIGTGAFYDCTNLRSFYVDAENKNFSSSDGVLFNKEKTDLIQHPAGNSRRSYTVPYGVTTIEIYAFTNCSNLTDFSIPDSVSTLSCLAFYGSGYYNNKNNWENNVLYIDNFLIESKNSGDSYSVKQGTKVIASEAFEYLSALTSVQIPNSVTTICNMVFKDCKKLENVLIPDSITALGNGVFQGCESLEYITLPDSITKIGDLAFGNCYSLSSIILPNKLTNIAAAMFGGCSALTSINIPKSVTSIGGLAFYACSSLKDVYYGGTEDEWKKINIGGFNEPLENATIHYTKPVVEPQNPQSGTPNQPQQSAQQNTPNGSVQTTHPSGQQPTAPVKKAPKGAELISGEYIAKKQKNTSVKTAKAGKKSATVSWKKVSGVNGYEVQYSTSKKFTKKSTKKTTIKKNKTTKTTIKKLKSKKTYYVRIRTYKNVKFGGKTVKVYSLWSKAKNVKIK